MIVFETKRLAVRYLREDDFDTFYELCADPAVTQYMGDNNPLTAEQTRQWIGISQANYAKQGYGCFAITLRQTGEMIGFGGLVYPPGEPQVEIIYAFKPSCWGMGFASEFARSMLNMGFQRWGLERILATIDPANTASIHVVEKLGMKFLYKDVDEHGLPTLFYALDKLQ